VRRLNAIRDFARSVQKKVADAMEKFQVAGIRRRTTRCPQIEESTAVKEARLDMAMGNSDQQKVKVEGKPKSFAPTTW